MARSDVGRPPDGALRGPIRHGFGGALVSRRQVGGGESRVLRRGDDLAVDLGGALLLQVPGPAANWSAPSDSCVVPAASWSEPAAASASPAVSLWTLRQLAETLRERSGTGRQTCQRLRRRRQRLPCPTRLAATPGRTARPDPARPPRPRATAPTPPAPLPPRSPAQRPPRRCQPPPRPASAHPEPPPARRRPLLDCSDALSGPPATDHTQGQRRGSAQRVERGCHVSRRAVGRHRSAPTRSVTAASPPLARFANCAETSAVCWATAADPC